MTKPPTRLAWDGAVVRKHRVPSASSVPLPRSAASRCLALTQTSCPGTGLGPKVRRWPGRGSWQAIALSFSGIAGTSVRAAHKAGDGSGSLLRPPETDSGDFGRRP